MDDVAVVLKAADDEMGEEGLRVAARVQCCLHRAVLVREMEGERRTRLPPARRPSTAPEAEWTDAALRQAGA